MTLSQSSDPFYCHACLSCLFLSTTGTLKARIDSLSKDLSDIKSLLVRSSSCCHTSPPTSYAGVVASPSVNNSLDTQAPALPTKSAAYSSKAAASTSKNS